MYSNNSKGIILVYISVLVILNCNLVFSISNCNNCKDTFGDKCSSNQDCYSGYCNSTGICASYIPCTSTNITTDDCPVDSNNFICFRNSCIPTIDQVAPAPCKTNSNCATNKCSNNICLEDTCGKNSGTYFSNYCKWNKYCFRSEFPNGDISLPPTISYVCINRDNDECGGSAFQNNCLPGYKCSVQDNKCLPNFSGSLGMKCLNKINNTVDSLVFCDISQGLVCQDNLDKTGLECSKYDSSVKTCTQDSDCSLAPFEKCSCEGRCISKYNLNSECKESINSAYQCATSNNSPIFTNAFYTNCSKESCNFVRSCIKKDYDSKTCHHDSLYMCPSFDWSDPINDSSSLSSSSSNSSSSSSSSNSTLNLTSSEDKPNSSISIYNLINNIIILLSLPLLLII